MTKSTTGAGTGATDDWTTVFEGQTPAQVKAALDAAADWTTTFGDDKPADVKKAVDDSRRWETRAKANYEKAKQVDGIVEQVTGQKPGDDVAGSGQSGLQALADQIRQQGQQIRDTKVENAVLRGAASHGADAARLTDSRAFMATVDALDATAVDFPAKVSDAIKKAVDADDRLKADNGTAADTAGGARRPAPNGQQGRPSSGITRRDGQGLMDLMRPPKQQAATAGS